MGFTPLNEKLLVRPDEAITQTEGGLFIPDTSQDRPLLGTVLSVPVSVTSLKEGDRIMYGQYSGIEIKLDGETLLILREKDVYGIIT